MSESSHDSVYLDTSILTSWQQILNKPKEVSLPQAAQKCKKLLDFIIGDRLNCKFQTSEWALSEMVQTLRDRAILKKFLLDGHEVSAFNRHKSKYPIEEDERGVIHDSIKNFEKYLNDLDVEFVELKLDRAKVQEYCLKYALETPDSIHLLAATQNSAYLATIDKPFLASKITEVQVIDPGTLITKRELRWH